ncbi:MAG TPA: hypothetical protein VGM27_25745 [Acidobacteriaceae bacterium]
MDSFEQLAKSDQTPSVPVVIRTRSISPKCALAPTAGLRLYDVHDRVMFDSKAVINDPPGLLHWLRGEGYYEVAAQTQSGPPAAREFDLP